MTEEKVGRHRSIKTLLCRKLGSISKLHIDTTHCDKHIDWVLLKKYTHYLKFNKDIDTWKEFLRILLDQGLANYNPQANLSIPCFCK